MVLAAKIGFKPGEIKALTLKDFNIQYTGYVMRQEEEWDRTRHLMSYILNYGGMGAKEFYRPEQIYPLRMDREGVKKKISNILQASELLKEFYGSTVRISDRR